MRYKKREEEKKNKKKGGSKIRRSVSFYGEIIDEDSVLLFSCTHSSSFCVIQIHTVYMRAQCFSITQSSSVTPQSRRH